VESLIVGLCWSRRVDSRIVGLSGTGEWTVEFWGCPEQESGQLNCGAVRNRRVDSLIVGLCGSRRVDSRIVGLSGTGEWTVELWGCMGAGEWTVELWGCPEQESGQLNFMAVWE